MTVDRAMTSHRRITGKLVIATHNPGKLAEMRELLAPHGIEAISAGELGLGEPNETGDTFRANAAMKAVAAATGRAASRASPTISAWWSTRSTARRNFFGALGGTNKDFAAAMARIERLLQERGADAAGAAQRAFRLRAVRGLARRSSRGGRGARRRHAGVAAARHARIRLRPAILADGHTRHLRRDDQHEKHGLPPRGLGLSHRRVPSPNGGDTALTALTHDLRSACMCTGRIACRNVRIATSIGTCATRPSDEQLYVAAITREMETTAVRAPGPRLPHVPRRRNALADEARHCGSDARRDRGSLGHRA